MVKQMGWQTKSKDELLFLHASYGNAQRIAALCRQGAGLEWTDIWGKTPLMVASMSPKLYNAAKRLIELGADVNNYRYGSEGGTPLHHAANQGLERTVQLLLSHGANALVVNDDGQSALDVARTKGHTNVVRTIESHLCLFAGWLRKLTGPAFLEFLVPHLVSRNVWVVVLPCGSRTLTTPFKLELAIYTSLQDAKPCIHLALWRANLEEPKVNQPDPVVIISDTSTKMQIKLAAANENEKDKHQLQRFCYACKGIPQVFHQIFPFNIGAPILPPHAETTSSITSKELHFSSGNVAQFKPLCDPPHSSTPAYPKGLQDSRKNTNDVLSQEVMELQSQIKSLQKKAEDHDIEIQKLQAQETSRCAFAKEVINSVANQIRSLEKKAEDQDIEIKKLQAQETSRCAFAKEVINSVANQLREMTEKLPRELLSSESFKDMQSRVEAFLNANSASGSSGEDTPHAAISKDSFSVQRSDTGSSSSTSSSEGQKEVVEQFEDGVYVTLIQFPDGTNWFKRVRFSKKWFVERQAEEWWKANKERVLRKYPVHAANGTKPRPSTAPATAPEESNGSTTRTSA